MKCPVCTTIDLLMSDRQAVEIDYCPQCRGVWLDRGELDKIIERSSSAAPVSAQQPPAAPEQRYRDAGHSSSHTEYGSGHDNHHDSKHRYVKSYNKKSLLKELFDF